MGQSFWSRGPSLSTRFTADDFPGLKQDKTNYAFVLQAMVELTQLLHNVHDILYSSKARTFQMMFSGDYNRYLDDFRHALSVWKDTWASLKLPHSLHYSLHIFNEYVSLYVNAFSFQSVATRACVENCQGLNRRPSLFRQGIMTSPDGAYVFAAVNAAKRIMIMVTTTNSEAYMPYMPYRIYV